MNGTSKCLRNPAKWKWHFPKATRSCQCEPFCTSPWTHHVLRKAQTDRGWEWGVSAAWNSFPQQKDVKSWWWKQFDIMCFLMVHGDICRNMFARAPDVWDDLGGHQNVQAQNRLPRHPLVRECCTALCQARHFSPCYRSSLVTTSVWMFARVF